MRDKIIAGNWKMNLTRDAAVALAAQLAEGVAKATDKLEGVQVVMFPPSVYVGAVADAIGRSKSKVAWGVQNVYYEPNGAFTGEISVAMLQDLGCRYVILGHSERRHILGESDETVNKKVLAALKGGLIPIVCVGETQQEREAGKTLEVIERQVCGSLAGVDADQMRGTVIAYEPVWAIGKGKTPATPQQAQEVHLALRKILADRYNNETAEAVCLLYGGNVNAGNARDLLSQPDIDGVLVGGASLKADEFMKIVAAARG